MFKHILDIHSKRARTQARHLKNYTVDADLVIDIAADVKSEATLTSADPSGWKRSGDGLTNSQADHGYDVTVEGCKCEVCMLFCVSQELVSVH